jgi:hypothetical protein
MWYFPLGPNPEADHLKILFSPFTDSAEIINYFNESQAAYNALLNYDNFAEGEYLTLTHIHIRRILIRHANFLGKVYRAKSSWTDSDRDTLSELVNNNREFINSELSQLEQKIQSDVTNEDLNTIRNLIQNYLIYFFDNHFPNDTWFECGYISSCLLSRYNTFAHKIAFELYPYDKRYEILYKRSEELFREEFVRASLSSLSNPSYDDLLRACRRKYDAPNQQIPNWSDDDLSELLSKLDFNIKGFSKALVRICGISVLLAGAAGKIASIVTVNPSLNEVCIKGLVIGATLAISPGAAVKLAEKFEFNRK